MCQPACKPGSVWPTPFPAPTWRPFFLGVCYQTPPATNPDDRPKKPCKVTLTRRPYLVLLPVGFALPLLLPVARCALTAPFHPYSCCVCRSLTLRAVYFLWHCPWGRPRRQLTGTVFPWSPDFPRRFSPPRPPGRLTHDCFRGDWAGRKGSGNSEISHSRDA
jgi:hypothetical protein